MVCPACGYRYGFWAFFRVMNPWKWFCRGCGNRLVLRGFFFPVTLAVLSAVVVLLFLDKTISMAVTPVNLAVLLFGLGIGFAAEWLVWNWAHLEVRRRLEL